MNALIPVLFWAQLGVTAVVHTGLVKFKLIHNPNFSLRPYVRTFLALLLSSYQQVCHLRCDFSLKSALSRRALPTLCNSCTALMRATETRSFTRLLRCRSVMS